MNNKVLLTSFLISIFIHALVLISFTDFSSSTKVHFSKNKGKSNAKVTIQLRDKIIKKKVLKKKRKNKSSKKIAKEVEKKPEPPTPDETLTRSKNMQKDQGQDHIVANYLSSVRKLIAKYKYKNRISTKLNLKGEVGLSFNIDWPNNLKQLKVLKSSGNEPLDESAMETVSRIEKLPSMPDQLKGFSLPVKVTLVYD